MVDRQSEWKYTSDTNPNSDTVHPAGHDDEDDDRALLLRVETKQKIFTLEHPRADPGATAGTSRRTTSQKNKQEMKNVHGRWKSARRGDLDGRVRKCDWQEVEKELEALDEGDEVVVFYIDNVFRINYLFGQMGRNVPYHSGDSCEPEQKAARPRLRDRMRGARDVNQDALNHVDLDYKQVLFVKIAGSI